MDLSDVFEEGGIDDDTPLKDQVIDGLLDSAKCSPYGDGKIYIAPFDASPMGLVYNKTLFEENGWETPVTWDDFFELGEKAKERVSRCLPIRASTPATSKACCGPRWHLPPASTT